MKWCFGAVLLAMVALVVYGTVQQDMRMGANDPQIQLAEDAATSLEAGMAPASVLSSAKIDIAASLAPYRMVFDDAGNPLASEAVLHGQTPAIPKGIFDYVRAYGEDRITWQPEPGVRSAVVIVHYGGAHPGFVLAGRSLREVEQRVDKLTFQVAAFFVVSELFFALGIMIFAWHRKKMQS